MTPKKIIIPCAGLGTRLLPISAIIPKELLPIGKWPAVFHTILEAFHAGIQRVVIVASAGKKEFIRQAFTPKGDLIQALNQAGKSHLTQDLARLGLSDRMTIVEQYPLAGLGHAVLCAQDVIGDEPFCVALPDEHFIIPEGEKNELEWLIEAYKTHNKSCVSMMEVPQEALSSYGIAKLGKSLKSDVYEIQGCVEKPPVNNAPSRFAFIGRYLFEPALWDHLKRLKPGSGGEIQLTDAMNRLADKGTLTGHIFKGERIDTGTYDGYYTCVSRYIHA